MMKRVIAAVLTAAVITTGTASMCAFAGASADVVLTEVSSETADAGEDSEYASRIEQEKAYLLQALDQLQEWGISPIAIWARITGDDTVLEIVESAADSVTAAADSLSETLSEAGTNAVNDLTESVTDAVSEAVEEETGKMKQSFLDQIRETVNSFLDGL